jgi:hypothetical protein
MSSEMKRVRLDIYNLTQQLAGVKNRLAVLEQLAKDKLKARYRLKMLQFIEGKAAQGKGFRYPELQTTVCDILEHQPVIFQVWLELLQNGRVLKRGRGWFVRGNTV